MSVEAFKQAISLLDSVGSGQPDGPHQLGDIGQGG